jgi:hypothetical protein
MMKKLYEIVLSQLAKSVSHITAHEEEIRRLTNEASIVTEKDR